MDPITDAPASTVFPILGTPRNASATGKPGHRHLLAAAIILASVAIPVVFTAFAVEPPKTRDIHIEAYRYGFSPSRIEANRGDHLRLTFSTRDTGQSFFFQDYDLHVAITPGSRQVSVHRLSRPDDPPVEMEAVEVVAGLPGWRGMLVSKSQFRNHTYNGPLHGTERGELVVAPNFLLHVGIGMLIGILLAGLVLAGSRNVHRSERRRNLFELFPWLKKAMRAQAFQSNLMLPMLGVFWFVILAGLLGTKVAGRNAGPMVIWVVWLSSLIVVLVPIGGRSWCTVCPLPTIGEWMQRLRFTNNPAAHASNTPLRFLGIPLVWPAALSNAWPRVLFFLLLGTFSTTIVALPPATSWMLIALVVLAVLLSFFPEQRLFCRHVCPINSYISLYSTTGRVLVRSVSGQKCDACVEKFCLTGSAKGWGCPYGICIGDTERNNDCGACMECVKTCAYDNVAVFWRSNSWDKEVANSSEAWQAMVMFALACVYCFINLGSWDKIRDWIDIIDKRNWGTFAVYAVALWALCLGLLPLVWYLLTRIGTWIGKSSVASKVQFRATTAALIPIGLGCWIAFATATFLEMNTFVLQSLSDPFNWGWNLLGMAGSRWHIIWASAIPWLQVACVLVGLAYSLQALYRCWLAGAKSKWQAVLGSLPLGAFLWSAAAGMIYFFAG